MLSSHGHKKDGRDERRARIHFTRQSGSCPQVRSLARGAATLADALDGRLARARIGLDDAFRGALDFAGALDFDVRGSVFAAIFTAAADVGRVLADVAAASTERAEEADEEKRDEALGHDSTFSI